MPAQTDTRIERFVIAAAVLSIVLALFACRQAPPVDQVAVVPAGSGGIPNLAGVWRLNTRDSDQPGRPAGGSDASGRGGAPGGNGGFGGGGGGAGGFGGRGGRGGRGGGGGGGGNTGARQQGDGSGPQGVRQIAIQQTDTTIALSRGDGRTAMLFFDGRTVLTQGPMGEIVDSSSGRWHGAKFEVQHRLPRGGEVSESYELSNDGKKLVVRTRTRIDADTSAREMRLVYDITTR